MSNRIYDAFDSVSAGRELKEKTKAYLSQASVRRHSGSARYAAAVACLLFVLLGIGGYAFYMTPVAAISIDVNPSMEWEVNRLDRVVSVICYNKEAEHVVEKLHLKHRKYDEAITVLLTSREMSGYLAESTFPWRRRMRHGVSGCRAAPRNAQGSIAGMSAAMGEARQTDRRPVRPGCLLENTKLFWYCRN